ncbi:hypothetical protein BBK36DRAFT_1138983 [Trichoderma citrinoviride]|uniref:Uncharacterized protein n=1 Tax=Trichoderma citrinoviride TaxID=58853 RepID=A0A2T4BHZ7_9HYPO|nr:hypothetical protein BBK36DRAFT_1138983 [Trichoderma citrinoviride]PTB68891.1 hypothetical protein BBK36DRAFT_1138983 [Trichoderma citrinoviride]
MGAAKAHLQLHSGGAAGRRSSEGHSEGPSEPQRATEGRGGVAAGHQRGDRALLPPAPGQHPTMHCVAGPGRPARLALSSSTNGRNCCFAALELELLVLVLVLVLVLLEPFLAGCMSHCAALAVPPPCTVSDAACRTYRSRRGIGGETPQERKDQSEGSLPAAPSISTGTGRPAQALLS